MTRKLINFSKSKTGLFLWFLIGIGAALLLIERNTKAAVAKKAIVLPALATTTKIDSGEPVSDSYTVSRPIKLAHSLEPAPQTTTVATEDSPRGDNSSASP